jgi:hypothetical protein
VFFSGGIFAIIGLIMSAILAFALAAPLGMCIGKLLNNIKRKI